MDIRLGEEYNFALARQPEEATCICSVVSTEE
jgi:hypothetical protein